MSHGTALPTDCVQFEFVDYAIPDTFSTVLNVTGDLAATAIVFTAVLSAPLYAQQAPTDSVVRRLRRKRVDARRFAGIVVGFVSREDAHRVIAYGPNSGVQPFDGNTEFEIGSSDSHCSIGWNGLRAGAASVRGTTCPGSAQIDVDLA